MKDMLEYAAEDSIMYQDGYRDGIKRTLGKINLQVLTYLEGTTDENEAECYMRVLDYISELERSSDGRFLF